MMVLCNVYKQSVVYWSKHIVNVIDVMVQFFLVSFFLTSLNFRCM